MITGTLGATASGLLLYFSSPGSGGPDWLAGLAWLALTPLLLAIKARSWRPAAALGLLAGLIYHLPLLHWITIVLGYYGGVQPAVAWLALGLLALYMSLYPALFCALLVSLSDWGSGRESTGGNGRPRAVGYWMVWAAPVIWVALDVIRARLFTGFPWQDLGYSQYQWPLLTQVADLGGHHAITFLIVLSGALLAVTVQQHRIFGRSARLTYMGYAAPGCLPEDAALLNGYGPLDRQVGTPGERLRPGVAGRSRRLPRRAIYLLLPALLALLVLAANPLYGALRLQQWSAINAWASGMEVAVIQGNISQDDKWDYELQAATIDQYLALSDQAMESRREKPPELLVWPETAMPFYPLEHPLFSEVIDFVAQRQIPLLTGAPHRQWREDDQPVYYNSAMLISPDPTSFQPADIYRKQHLVPFGEYIPLRRLLPFFAPVVETLGDFTPGPEPNLLRVNNGQVGVLICFEAIFPRLARQMTGSGADLLVNITNDAWFGPSNAPHQHLSMAALRAVENRRSLARAANTGISVFVTPEGRLLQATALFTPDQRRATLPLPDPDAPTGRYLSPFTAGGFLFGPACLLLLMAGIIRHIHVIVRR